MKAFTFSRYILAVLCIFFWVGAKIGYLVHFGSSLGRSLLWTTFLWVKKGKIGDLLDYFRLVFLYDLLPEVVADISPLKRGGMSVSHLHDSFFNERQNPFSKETRWDCYIAYPIFYFYSSMSPFITFGNWEIRNDSGN